MGATVADLCSLLVCVAEDGDEYDRTLAIHNFLFGYEFADTAIAFCRDPDTVVIITSQKKCKILEAIGKDDKPVPIKLQLHAVNKADKNAANIATFINKLKGSKSGVSAQRETVRQLKLLCISEAHC